MSSAVSDIAPFDETRYRRVIDQLQIPNEQKHYLYARWLPEVEKLYRDTATNRKWNVICDVVTQVGGLIFIPYVLSLPLNIDIFLAMSPLVALAGSVVGVASYAKKLFKFDEQATLGELKLKELLKSFWEYTQAGGSYRFYRLEQNGVQKGGKRFVDEIENILSATLDSDPRLLRQPQETGEPPQYPVPAPAVGSNTPALVLYPLGDSNSDGGPSPQTDDNQVQSRGSAS